MAPFGSRKDDPLLQDDPLAPPSDEGAGEEDDSTGDVDPETHADESTDEGAAVDGEDADAESRSLVETGEASRVGETTDPSVFEDSGDRFKFGRDGDTRVVTRSAEGASEGRLTVLNAAFEQGWTLDRVELRNDEGGEVDRMSIAFVLRRARKG
ncbi:hypothetical protein BSZ35_18655 [Salinibacter sp. 10B]|nr:hypothetical protein BSZ35_18655 [Salinibacter sp. 10B]